MDPCAFPPSRASDIRVDHPLFEGTLRLRGAADADRPALLALYGTTREEEMAAAPWPAEVKSAFLAQQFSLQHRHYVTHFPDADFLAIDSPDGLVGRLYRGRAAAGDTCDTVIDLCLLPGWRGHAIGTSLLVAVMERAAACGHDVALQVLGRNERARRLYERLGFTVTAANDPYLAMRWRAATA